MQITSPDKAFEDLIMDKILLFSSPSAEPPVVGAPLPTPRLKRTIASAEALAIKGGLGYVGVEELLLALLGLGDGAAHDLLNSVGVSSEDLRARLMVKYDEIRGNKFTP